MWKITYHGLTSRYIIASVYTRYESRIFSAGNFWYRSVIRLLEVVYVLHHLYSPKLAISDAINLRANSSKYVPKRGIHLQYLQALFLIGIQILVRVLYCFLQISLLINAHWWVKVNCVNQILILFLIALRCISWSGSSLGCLSSRVSTMQVWMIDEMLTIVHFLKFNDLVKKLAI